jgi:hypothetical protein
VKVHADVECTLKITVVSATDPGAAEEASSEE